MLTCYVRIVGFNGDCPAKTRAAADCDGIAVRDVIVYYDLGITITTSTIVGVHVCRHWVDIAFY